nr:MAG TPA: NikA, BACTERIAL CONJUGATION, RELAXASE, DNA [Caudoviricetes sp.]
MIKKGVDFCSGICYYLCSGKSEVIKMSPRTGRPPKLGESKTVSLQLRITKETADKLQECADALSISRTEVIEKGIETVHERVKK